MRIPELRFTEKNVRDMMGIGFPELCQNITEDSSLTEKVRYYSGYTYDLLPAGDTGFYFALGVLLGSTLSPNSNGRIRKVLQPEAVCHQVR